MAIARGGGVGVSDTVRASSSVGAGVFRGLDFSSFPVDLEFPLFLVLSEVFVALDFFFMLFGFGVGVWRRFRFGIGDSFDFETDAACVSASSD